MNFLRHGRWILIVALGIAPALTAQGLADSLRNATPEQIQKAKEAFQSNPELVSQLINQQEVKTRKDSIVSQAVIDDIRGKNLHMLKPSTGDSLTKVKTVTADTLKPAVDSAALRAKAGEVYGVHLFSDNNIGSLTVDVPEEYVIVPGDQILLRLWGRYNLEKIYTVGMDGYVFMDPLNKQTYLKGMTHRRLKQMIRDVIKEMAGVEGEAKVIASHPVSIHVSGFAKVPGTMLVTPYSTFWQVLMQSKGPSPLGSVREINLIRDNRVVHSFDIYEYLQSGRIANVGMMNNDVLFFSAKKKWVEVEGLTNITGLFEVKASETLGDLISIAGNLSTKSISPVIHIERQIPLSERHSAGPTNQAIDLELAGNAWMGFKLLDGDRIGGLMKRYELRNQVYLSGNGVKVPGKYSITHGKTTLGEIITKAGDLAEGYDRKIEVLRPIPGGVKSFPLDAGDPAFRAFPLESNDSILTYHATDFKDTAFVLVRGFVRKMDTLVYAESMTLKDVIQRAGGVREGSVPYVFVKQTDSIGQVGYAKVDLRDADTYLVRPRDEIIAFDYRGFNRRFQVTVLTDDAQPKVLEYSDDLDLEYVIHAVGGLLPNVDSAHVEIHSPNFGASTYKVAMESYAVNDANLHKKGIIRPGAMIVIRQNPLKVIPSFVTLIGEFKRPGQYVLESKTTTVAEVIRKAGGLGERANPYGISIKRRNVKSVIPVQIDDDSPLEFASEVYLVRGDTIFVQDNNLTVTISGAVLNEGTTQYVRGQSWSEYVDMGAGGTLDTADVKKTFIIYPNGTAAKAHPGWFSNSDVRPGSEIVVPIKPYKDPAKLQPTDWAKVTASISAILGILLSTLIIMQNVKSL